MEYADIWIDNEKLPPIKKEGLSISREPVWSANTGRGADGIMGGDIVAYKYTLKCSFTNMDQKTIAKVLRLTKKPFFNVKFLDPEQETDTYKTITMYAGTPTIPVYSFASGMPRYAGVTCDFVEQ